LRAMANATIWRKRIAAWRASGMTALEFAQARSLSAQQIWNWSWRLRRDELAACGPRRAAKSIKHAATKCVRLARVVRVATEPPPVSPSPVGLVVELCGVRIAVPAGFDRATFSAVLEEVERRQVGRP
jgi:hypothetical protein